MSKLSSSSSTSFRDQVKVLEDWFKEWNECEQTVAMYALFKKLGPIQSKFLSTILDNINGQAEEKIRVQEEAANDPERILCLSNSGSASSQAASLLVQLPLLRTGNKSAKREMLGLLSRLLRSGSPMEESRQLLSYALIHPALTVEERRSLNLWCHQLEDQMGSKVKGGEKEMGASRDSCQGLNSSSPPHHEEEKSSEKLVSATSQLLTSWRILSIDGREERGRMVDGGNNGSLMNSGRSVSSTNSLPGRASNGMAFDAGLRAELGHESNGIGMSGRSNSLTAGFADLMNVHHYSNNDHNHNQRGTTGLYPANNSFGRKPPENGYKSKNDANGKKMVNNNGQLMYNGPLSSSSTPPVTILNRENGSQTNCDSSSNQIRHIEADDKYNSFMEEGSGMRDVPAWLKSLRLHKYSSFFSSMSYEEMMALTEVDLERHGITKGARHKIVLNLEKLRNRQEILRSLEKSIMDEGGTYLKEALREVKGMLLTPLKPWSPNGSSGLTLSPPMLSTSASSSSSASSNVTSSGSGSSGEVSSSSDGENNNINSDKLDCDNLMAVREGDIPGQITRLLGKVCSTLLFLVDDESLNLFLNMLDKCLNHEAFSPKSKKRIFSWKQQMEGMKQNALSERRSSVDSRAPRGRYAQNGFQKIMTSTSGSHQQLQQNNMNGISNGSSFGRKKVDCGMLNKWNMNQNNNNNNNNNNNQKNVLDRNRGNIASGPVIKRPSLPEHMNIVGHGNIYRSNSAPDKRHSSNTFPSATSGLVGGNYHNQQQNHHHSHHNNHVNNHNQNHFNRPGLDMRSTFDSDLLDNQMKSLCIRMTEQALEPLSDGGYLN